MATTMLSQSEDKENTFLSQWKKFWSEPGFAVLSISLILVIFLFIILPILSVLLKSFGIGSGAFTLTHYKQFFKTDYYLRALQNSILSAFLSTTVIIFLSICMALYVTRSNHFFARIYRGVSVLPLVAPPVIFSLALIILFGRNGLITPWINQLFGIDFSIYGFGGVVITQVLGYFPVGFMLIEATIRHMNQDIEHASRDLGANQFRTLFKIILPLARSGIIKAALLVFVMVIADFSNPMIIGGGKPFLASEAYLTVIGQNNLELAAVLGVFLIIPSLIVFIFQSYYLNDTGLETIQGESGGANLPLNRSIQWSVLFINTAFILFIVTVFTVVVLGAFVKIIGVNHQFTFEHFANRSGWHAIRTSIIVSFFSALFAAALGILQGYLFARKPVPFKRVLEFLTLFGLAVPGTVMGIGYILVFNGPPFFLTGTMAIIILNMTFQKIGVSLEAAISKMHQIDPSMEEASYDLGSGPYRTFFNVVIPLLSPSFFAGFVYTFMTTMVSISSVIFLISPGTNLAAVYIFTLAQHAKIGMASAVSFILIVIVIACMSLLKWIENRTGIRI